VGRNWSSGFLTIADWLNVGDEVHFTSGRALRGNHARWLPLSERHYLEHEAQWLTMTSLRHLLPQHRRLFHVCKQAVPTASRILVRRRSGRNSGPHLQVRQTRTQVISPLMRKRSRRNHHTV
jgi:hypothetical protein